MRIVFNENLATRSTEAASCWSSSALSRSYCVVPCAYHNNKTGNKADTTYNMNTVVALCCGVPPFLEFIACGLIWKGDTVELWFLLEGTRRRAGRMIKFDIIWISLFKYLNFEKAHHSIKPSENATVAEDTLFVTITSFNTKNCDLIASLGGCSYDKKSKFRQNYRTLLELSVGSRPHYFRVFY